MANYKTPVDDLNPHGLRPSDIEALDNRGRELLGTTTAAGWRERSLVDRILPKELRAVRAAPLRRQGQAYGNGSSAAFANSRISPNIPILPEFTSDRQSYPRDRIRANYYWRMFGRMDPVVGPVIEMMAELIWSDFQLTGEGVDGSIKRTLEHMCTKTKLRAMLTAFVKEYLLMGEVIPHLFWDGSAGIWNSIGVHNPDTIEVYSSPIGGSETFLEYEPDERMKQLMQASDPMSIRLRETMPAQLRNAFSTGQALPLDPVYASLIARKQHPYEVRGTSIMSRLWRLFIVEDAAWEATIQTFRRMAAPIRVAKLGSGTPGGAMGTPEENAQLRDLLAACEADPAAWLLWNTEVSFEMVGDPQRSVNIGQVYPFIEQIKLSALGVSKAFLSGDSTYNAAAAGLTIFLQRMKSIREIFVNEWLMPKYFLPVAVMDGWKKPNAKTNQKPSRLKRSSQDDMEDFSEEDYIVPTIVWKKTLDADVDGELISAMQTLENNLGIKLTDQKKYSAVGLDFESQAKQLIKEHGIKKRLAGEDPELQALFGLGAAAQPAEGGGGGGLGGPPPAGPTSMPGIPPESFGLDDGSGGDLGAPADEGSDGEEAPAGDEGGEGSIPDAGQPIPSAEAENINAAPGKPGRAQPPKHLPAKKPGLQTRKTQGPKQQKEAPPTETENWSQWTLQPILSAFKTFDPFELQDSDPWAEALKNKQVQEAFNSQDSTELWEAIENYLYDQSYPYPAIQELRHALRAHKLY